MASCSSFQDIRSIKTVLALFLQTCYVLGTIKSIGVYLPALEQSLGLTSTDTGLALGLFDAFAFGPGPVVAYLYKRLRGGYRRGFVMTGSLLATSGLLIASSVTNGVELALCLSIAGLGSNILSISLVIALSDQSGDAFGILYGIGKSGYAFGMALVPLLADYLMSIYGWRGSLMIIGGIMAHLIPLTLMADFTEITVQEEGNEISYSDGRKTDNHFDTTDIHVEPNCDESLVRSQSASNCSDPSPLEGVIQNENVIIPLEEVNEETRDNAFLIQESSTCERRKKMSVKRCRIKGQMNCSELSSAVRRICANSIYNRDRWMILLMFVTMVFAMVDGGWHAFLIPRAVDLGVPTFNALALAYSGAAAAFIGRCFGGLLLNSKLISGQCWFLVLTFLNVASLLLDIFVPRFELMIVTAFITSLTIAERNILVLVICKERAPLSEFPVILASSEIVFGVGTFLGAFFSGYVADITETFNASFMFIAAVDACVFFLMVPPIVVKGSSDRVVT
ncbi:uncharacterized protein LOC121416555 [Lytechinus variegatus]|uniref:uncharacterized protein LOC121416555 n=1 Tax=Lytechinus variegatus TaxID=7654 RepID=UPI001BB1C5E9|nr:uncharacterized protein LOC121416555 [Lytechinus variegatus]